MTTANKIENKATLVTAIYDYKPQEIIGGRGWSFDYYAAPFLNILKLDLPIVIYTHDRVVDQLKDFMQRNFKGNYKIILHDLHDFKYSSQILHLKNSTGIFDHGKLKDDISVMSNDRNHILCLSKLYWLHTIAKTNPFASHNFFWVDAGLCHHGIFPEKFGGRERFSKQEYDHTLYYPENEDNIFNPSMGAFLSSNIEGFLSIIHKSMPINLNMKSLLDKENKSIGYIVGGLFGGKYEPIQKVLNDFDEGLKICLDNNIITLEEDLLSCISANNTNIYNTFSFSTWHHDIAGEPCFYDVDKEAECFYKIFKNSFVT